MAEGIEDTFGSMFIGACITLALYGITTLQAYFYFIYYPKDSLPLKCLVAVLWSLDTLHTIFMCHSMYFYLVTAYTNPAAMADTIWSLTSSVAANLVIAFIVQGFFTLRIYSLCKSKRKYWITGVIGSFVIGHLAFGIATVVEFFGLQELRRLTEAKSVSVIMFAVTTVVSDIMIALALCLLLDHSRTEFTDTNSIINKLIIYAINRCILTAVVAIAETIAFKVIPDTYYTFAIDFTVGKLYANSLLATLNCRESLRSKWGSRSTQSTSSGAISTNFALTSFARGHHDTARGNVTTGTLDLEAVQLDRIPIEPSLEEGALVLRSNKAMASPPADKN